MQIKLAYGKQGLMLDLPDDWNATVIEPQYVPGLVDPVGAVRDALRDPIGRSRLPNVYAPKIASGLSLVTSRVPRRTG